MANRLPYPRIVCKEIDRPGYEPLQIRQTRLFSAHLGHAHVIGRFLQERGSVNLLTPEQTVALFKEIHWCAQRIRRLARRGYSSVPAWRASLQEARSLMSRIEAAEEELFIANRRLIVKCARHYFWLDQFILADFLQEGARTLANAVRCFDFTRGTPFIAYAQRSVQNRMRNCLRDFLRSGVINLHPSCEMENVRHALDRCRARHGKDPNDREVSIMTGLSETRVHKTRTYLSSMKHIPSSMVSLDALLGDTNQADLYDFIRDTKIEDAVTATERSEVWEWVDRLSKRDRLIIRLRFFDGRTLEETGRMLKLTRARIKQLQDRALWKMRNMLTSSVLKSVA